MKIVKNAAVEINYTLTDQDGKILDTTEGNSAMPYLQGFENILPALEAALEGKSKGDKVKITIEAKDGYGERDETLTNPVPREDLAAVEDLQVGGYVEAETDDGDIVFTVLEINDKEVLLDGNHPLAGITLNFDVTIADVRKATDEELAHGHIHDGEHGCE